MNRLTEYEYIEETGERIIWCNAIHEKAIERLANYEDTGLEPEAVDNLRLSLCGAVAVEIAEEQGYVEVNRAKEIAHAEAEGRLVILPCKVGDTVYALERFCDGNKGDCDSWVTCEECKDYQQEVSERRIGTLVQAVSVIEMLGETVFLTREEAEAVLKRSARQCLNTLM